MFFRRRRPAGESNVKFKGGVSPETGAPPGTGGILRRALRNLGYLIGGKAFSGVLSLAYLAFAVRSLGVTNYGQLILIYSFALTISQLVKFQTWQPILHYGAAALEEKRIRDFQSLIVMTLALDLASAVAGVAVAVGSIWIFGPLIGLSRAVLPQASLFGFALIFMVPAAASGLLRLFDRFDLLLIEDNVEALVRFVGSLALFFCGGHFNQFLVVWFLSVTASGLTCAGLAWYETAKHVPASGFGVAVRESVVTLGRCWNVRFPGVWKFVWSNNLNGTVGLIQNQVSTLIVGGFTGAADAALFRIARQIGQALSKPIKLMTPVFYPELARLVAKKEFGLLRALVRRATLISGGGAVLCFVVLYLLGRWILEIIGGHQVVGAYVVMLLLSAANLIRIGTFSFEPTLISLSRPARALAIQAIATVVYLPLLVVFLRISGIEGAGVATIVAATLTAIMQFIAVLLWFRSQTPAVAGNPL